MKDIQKIKEFFSKSLEESLTGGYPHTKTSGENFEKITITEPIDDATKSKMIKNFRAAGWDAKPNNGGGITAIKKAMMEAKEETAIDMAKKQLDQLGVKYEMSGNKFKPFKAIYKPIGESDDWYDKFDEIVYLFNLGSAVKSSMNEAKEQSLYKDWDQFEKPSKILVYLNNGKTLEITPLKLKGGKRVYDAILQAFIDDRLDITNKVIQGMTNNLSETKSEDVVDTITMDVPLFIRMLEYSREDASADVDLHDVTEKAISLNKEKDILSMDDYSEIVGAAEEIEEGFYGKGDKRRGLQNASKLSSAEYQMAKKLKSFKASDWKWNTDEDLYVKVNEVELTEANVPSNIKEFAKRKGVSSLVNKVAGWAEKVGKRIAGGTAIGKNYSTLVLDLDYQQNGEIRINTDDETVTLYDEPVNSFPEFKRVYFDDQDDTVKEGVGNDLDEPYFIEVSVRDARKAMDIFDDMYRRSNIKTYGSNVYAASTPEDIYDLYYDLNNQGIEILDYNVDGDLDEATDYMKRRKAQDDYIISKKDKPTKSYNPKPSGKTDYMKSREKELAEAILTKLKK
jgi:hypothetical protein